MASLWHTMKMEEQPLPFMLPVYAEQQAQRMAAMPETSVSRDDAMDDDDADDDGVDKRNPFVDVEARHTRVRSRSRSPQSEEEEEDDDEEDDDDGAYEREMLSRPSTRKQYDQAKRSRRRRN